MRVLTFSRTYPAYHPKKGQPTHFVEKIWKSQYVNGECPDPLNDAINTYVSAMDGLELASYNDLRPKWHTIRAGHRWKVGDVFSPRVWSGKPYGSKQVEFAPPLEVKKVWSFELVLHLFHERGFGWGVSVDGNDFLPDGQQGLAQNDGLELGDFLDWFKGPTKQGTVRFSGQIICWNPDLTY